MSAIDTIVEDDTETLVPAIVVGSLVGLAVLLVQPNSALPSLRLGPAPLVASAIGTVAGLAFLMLRDDAPEEWGDLIDDLAAAVESENDQDGGSGADHLQECSAEGGEQA